MGTNEFDMPLNNKTAGQVMDEYNQNAMTNWNDNVLEACPNCERTFNARPLEIHLKSCKPGNPLKPKLSEMRKDGPHITDRNNMPMMRVRSQQVAEEMNT